MDGWTDCTHRFASCKRGSLVCSHNDFPSHVFAHNASCTEADGEAGHRPQGSGFFRELVLIFLLLSLGFNLRRLPSSKKTKKQQTSVPPPRPGRRSDITDPTTSGQLLAPHTPNLSASRLSTAGGRHFLCKCVRGSP